MKRVAIIASGATERAALPSLLAHLEAEGIEVVEVRTPRRHHAVTVDESVNLIKASYWSRYGTPQKLDKVVVLDDVDTSDPEKIQRKLAPLRDIGKRVSDLGLVVLIAHAQQHLEAWFYADEANLRAYLDRSLGNVDTSKPDQIANPKQHLIKLLAPRRYTAKVAGEIANELSPDAIAQRSPSFRGLLAAVRNGGQV